MKSKSANQGGHSNETKSLDKDAVKSAKALHKKLLAKRAPIKLRASSGKCVANRTRDKSPKALVPSPSHRGISSPTERVKSGSRMPVSMKPRNMTLKRSGEDTTAVCKKSGEDTTAVCKKTARKPSSRTGVKSKSQKNEKGRSRRKTAKQTGVDNFLDLWAFASIGKREASLNASMKVNILYEKQSPSKSPRTSPKKIEAVAQDTKHDENSTDTVPGKGNITEASNTVRVSKKKPSESVKECSPVTDRDCESSPEQKKSPEKNDNKKAVFKSKSVDSSSSRKRKSPGYKIFKEEHSSKVRKVEKKSPVKAKNRLGKRSRKMVPSGHQLCNIIEKCPRQASLVAKAMIAMGQEEETVPGLAARTTVYDWMELRSLTQCETRKIQWFNGFGSIRGKKMRTADSQQPSKDDEMSAGGVDVENRSDFQAAVEESESLHNTLLRTLHQIGDSRLLKEYLRAQKEDFPGHVDVVSCCTPEKHQESPPAAADPKKLVSPPSANEKPEKEVDKPEKPVNCSPVKPQPCRAATPVPQFHVSQRTSNITSSFIHHPVAQPIYPQPHAHPHPQPIKVTPYTPSPTYIYQYAMDRAQAGLYAPPSPSPMPYGVGSNDGSHRDYASTFTLSHMGSISLGRRGVNPYPPAPYNPSLHLPMQQLGYNYSAYYPSPMQAMPQQNLAPMPMHQQYPLCPAPILTQHQIPADMSQLEPYQHEYAPYPPLPNLGPDTSCMPPPTLPPPPPAHRPTPMAPPPPPLRQPPMSHHSVPPVSPMESLRSMNPAGVQPIARSPALDFPASFVHHQGNPREQLFPPCRPHHQLTREHPVNPPFRYSVTCNGLNKSFSPCKKEHDDSSSFDCDFINKNSMCNNECLPRSLGSSRTNSEGSAISDLLHSAHTAMYQIDGFNSMDNIREFHHTQPTDSAVSNCSPSKQSISRHSSFSTSYSVSSILDMPACKVKSEPEPKVCTGSHLSSALNNFEQKIIEQPQSAFVCFAAAGSSGGSESKEAKDTPPNNIHKKNEVQDENRNISSNQIVKTEEKFDQQVSSSIIIIDDTDGSSDDEPLARLVKAKCSDDAESLVSETPVLDSHKKVGLISKSKTPSPHIPTRQPKLKVKQKDIVKDKATEQTKPVQLKQEKQVSVKLQTATSSKSTILKSQPDTSSSETQVKLQVSFTNEENKSAADKEAKNKLVPKKATLASSSKAKKPAKKIKTQPVWPQTPIKVNTNHGWSWIGEGEMKPIPKLTPGKEEPIRIRKSYHSMRHASGEIVSVRDCVILHSDGDGSIPFVAKVSALWENINGEMMFSMLWYYQPEHTALGREPEDGEQELFASKHREENSVACIDDKCFVLMYNEYCRLEAEGARNEQGVPLPRWRTLIPDITDEDKKLCRPLPPPNACADNIWFCRYDYDMRKKVVKKPKHKKSNLRYRAPCKPV